MELKLMMTNDNYDIMNKDKFTISIEQIHLPMNTDIINPVITIYTKTDLLNVNYAHIPELNRFYHISHKQVIGNNLTKLTLEVDVLESYKREILESQSILYLNSVLPHTEMVESNYTPQDMSYVLTTIAERSD